MRARRARCVAGAPAGGYDAGAMSVALAGSTGVSSKPPQFSQLPTRCQLLVAMT